MKTVQMSFARSLEYRPPHPERTAKRSMSGMNMDVVFKEFSTRAAMQREIDKQGQLPYRQTNWKACVR